MPEVKSKIVVSGGLTIKPKGNNVDVYKKERDGSIRKET